MGLSASPQSSRTSCTCPPRPQWSQRPRLTSREACPCSACVGRGGGGQRVSVRSIVAADTATGIVPHLDQRLGHHLLKLSRRGHGRRPVLEFGAECVATETRPKDYAPNLTNLTVSISERDDCQHSLSPPRRLSDYRGSPLPVRLGSAWHPPMSGGNLGQVRVACCRMGERGSGVAARATSSASRLGSAQEGAGAASFDRTCCCAGAMMPQGDTVIWVGPAGAARRPNAGQ